MKTIRIMALCATLAASSSVFAADKAGDAEKGKEVFQQCAVCHNADSAEKKMGPGLKGLFKRKTEAKVRSKVDEGGNGMPAYKEMLSVAERNDLIAYVKTL